MAAWVARGNLLVLNFGTIQETNRFKALAINRGFLKKDVFYEHAPGPLIRPGGIREVRRIGGIDVLSFYGLQSDVWNGKLPDGNISRDSFRDWVAESLSYPVDCLYMTGHHWDDHRDQRYMYLSWGEDASVNFSLKIDTDANKPKMWFGLSGSWVEVDVKAFRSWCQLLVGFGCNVATGTNSSRYQRFFGEPRPIILAWDRKIAVPRAEQISVNTRFFDYLEN